MSQHINHPSYEEDSLDRASEILINIPRGYAQSTGWPQRDSTKQRRAALQCLQQVTRLDSHAAEEYLDLGAKGVLVAGKQEARETESAAASLGSKKETKAWRTLAQIAFTNIIPDNQPTPACRNYETAAPPQAETTGPSRSHPADHWLDLAKRYLWLALRPHPGEENNRPIGEQIKPKPRPEHHPADEWLDLAQSAIAGAKPNLAMGYLERSLKLHPGEEERGRIALMYQQLKEYSRAVQIMDLQLQGQHSTKSARWLNDRGVLKVLMGKSKEAEEDLRAAIAREPEFWPAYLSLGGLYASSGRRAEALQVYQAALSKMPVGATGPQSQIYRIIHTECERMHSAADTHQEKIAR
jgi:hypothetical protein